MTTNTSIFLALVRCLSPSIIIFLCNNLRWLCAPSQATIQLAHKFLNVAFLFTGLKSSSAFVSPSGAVASAGTPRRGSSFSENSMHSQGSAGSQFPTSARRHGLPPRSPRLNPPNSSLEHSVASLSDISNASTHEVKDRSFKGENHYSEELPGLDARLVDGSTLSKVRAKLAAALYTGIGTQYQDKAAFFGAVDKNHDGFLDLSEMISMFRRVLKLSRDEVSDVQVKAIFSALGGRKRNCLDFHQFFALLGSSNDDAAAPAGEGEASKKTRRPSPRPMAQSPRSSLENNGISKKTRQSSSPASKFININRTSETATSAVRVAAPVDSTKELVSASISSNNEPPLALTDMMNDVKQLHGDFDAQLEELGEISKVRLLLITFLSEIWSVIHVPIRCEATHSSHTYSIFDLQLYRCLTNF